MWPSCGMEQSKGFYQPESEPNTLGHAWKFARKGSEGLYRQYGKRLLGQREDKCYLIGTHVLCEANTTQASEGAMSWLRKKHSKTSCLFYD